MLWRIKLNQVTIKDLIKEAKTDVSGKWISVQDLEEFTKFVILKSAQVADKNHLNSDKSRGEIIKEFFGVK